MIDSNLWQEKRVTAAVLISFQKAAANQTVRYPYLSYLPPREVSNCLNELAGNNYSGGMTIRENTLAGWDYSGTF